MLDTSAVTTEAGSTRLSASTQAARGPWLGFLTLATPLAILLVDTGWAFARGWRSESRLDKGLVALTAISLAIAVCTIILPAGRRFFSRFGPQLAVLSVTVLLSATVAEFVSRAALARILPPAHRRTPGLRIVYKPVPGVMRGVSGEAQTIVNSWGVRGPEPPARSAAYRILCLGGSTTNCTYLDESETWPTLVMNDLNAAGGGRRYWVGNAGIPSLTLQDHLSFVEHNEILAQVDCLIVQCGINDFMQALAPEPASPPLWQRSALKTLLLTVYRQYIDTANVIIEDEAGKSYVARRQIRAAAEKCQHLPNLSVMLDQFASRIRAVAARCRELGVRLVFTTQPTLWRSNISDEDESLLWFGSMGGGRYLAAAQLKAGMEQFNERLKSECAAMDVQVIDLASIDGRDDFFYDDCHFTETGAGEVAQTIADWWQQHPSVPDASAKK